MKFQKSARAGSIDIKIRKKSRVFEYRVILNKSFTTNSNFLITVYLKPDDVSLWYFKLRFFLLKRILNLRSTTWGCNCKDTVRKSEFVAKAQFICISNIFISNSVLLLLFCFYLLLKINEERKKYKADWEIIFNIKIYETSLFWTFYYLEQKRVCFINKEEINSFKKCMFKLWFNLISDCWEQIVLFNDLSFLKER